MKENLAFCLNRFYLYTDLNDEHVGSSCRKEGTWEPDVTAWMTNNIKPGWSCLDIGANIGYFTEVLSRIVKASGEVYSFEPNTSIVENYKKAQEFNQYDDCGKINLFNFGLSNKNETLYLPVPKSNPGGAGISNDRGSWDEDLYEVKDIEVRRLDSFFNKKVDFIKMDVEGGEQLAWEGFPDIVKQCPLMIIELGPYHNRSFLEELNSLYIFTEVTGQNVTVDGILEHPHFLNVVLTRR